MRVNGKYFPTGIIAKLPTIAAAAYKHTLGQPFMYPRNSLDYTSNLLRMFFAVPAAPYEVDPIAAEALDLLFILHADHEQKLLDFDGTAGRKFRDQSVFGNSVGHCRAVGGGSRWRKRSGTGHARGNWLSEEHCHLR